MAVREGTLEGMGMIHPSSSALPNPAFWRGKRVLITGHTGFKGCWLALWLYSMGAEINGIALDPPTNPNLFSLAHLSEVLSSDIRVDIRKEKEILEACVRVQPDIVIHMAAQALVRPSYSQPIHTFTTNALGTTTILEAIRKTPSVKVAVMITTDKVYENREWFYPYREIDTLGGNDPYSASKACAEIIIHSYRCSFLEGQGKSISSARAGNVIGGGDWSEERLVPDAIRAFISNTSLRLRNPDAIRPWQHVLDALAGYLLLAEAQWKDPRRFAKAWNFAPDSSIEATVGYVASQLVDLWGDGAQFTISPSPDNPAEAGLLRLDSSMARTHLGWQPRWSLDDALKNTVIWYKYWVNGGDIQRYSLNQIQSYMSGDS